MTVGDVPTIWLDLAESWLTFEVPAGLDHVLVPYLVANGVALEQTGDHAWLFEDARPIIVTAVDDFLDSQGMDSLCQRHEDDRYSWTVLGGNHGELPDEPEQSTVMSGDQAVPDRMRWPEVRLVPSKAGGTELHVSPSVHETIFVLLTMRNFRLQSCHPGPGDNAAGRYLVAADVKQVRRTLTEWLVREPDRTYIKTVLPPTGWTQIVITGGL
jgi:hypothetical protein